MPFIVESQPGEEIYLQKEFRGSHSHVFAMAVSNQAVYVSKQKFSLGLDTWYFKRVPLSEVSEVRLVKQRSIYIIVVSALAIAFGTVVTWLMMWGALHPTPGVPVLVSGWPVAILVFGIVMPFIATGRRTLVVKMRRDTFKWKPQLAVDRSTRELCARIQDEIVEACRKAGVTIETTS